MKTIVYILPYLEKGGTETHVLELIKGFLKKNYRIILAAPEGSRLTEFQKFNIDYIPFVRLDTNLFTGIKSLISALKKIRKENPDIIHIHGAHELTIPTRIIFKETPLFFTVHGYNSSLRLISYRMSGFLNNRLSDHTIAISKHERNIMLKTGLKKEKISLIYNGISIPEYNRENINNISRFQGKKIIATIGRLEKLKGIKYLIQAFKRINRDDSHLLIIGSGNHEKELKELANTLKIKDITFTGYINNIHDYLDIVDIFVLPSLQEAFGLVCAEAMAHKIPVIASNVGGIPEVVKDNITGYLVNPADIDGLKDKIKILLNNNNKAEQMGNSGYLRYKNLFTTNSMVTSTENIYLRAYNKDV